MCWTPTPEMRRDEHDPSPNMCASAQLLAERSTAGRTSQTMDLVTEVPAQCVHMPIPVGSVCKNVSIDGRRMTNETESRIPLDDLLVFHQLARSLTSSFDLDTILRTILEHMERFIEAELWTLLMLDDDHAGALLRHRRRRREKRRSATCA